LAAIALGNRSRQEDAESALIRCVSDPAQTAQLSGPGLCHGWAGTVASTWCASRDSPSGQLDFALETLAGPLAESVRDDHPSGLMNGIAGAALTLHAILADQGPGTWPGSLLVA
jgi:hypothetical protein